MNKLIRAGPLILLFGLSAGGVSRPGPTPINTEVLNIADLSYQGIILSSNPATFTVEQVYGVELTNKEGPEIIIKPYGNGVFWEYEVKNIGNGREPISLGYEIEEQKGSFSISFVRTRDGTETIQNPIELNFGESLSFLLKITPKETASTLTIRVFAKTLRDGVIGGEDISEDKPIITIATKPVIMSIHPSPVAWARRNIIPRVSFDENIDGLNLSMRMWRIVKKMILSDDRIPVLGSVYKNEKTMEFRPGEIFLPLTTYEVEILGNDKVIYSWQFTTMADDLSQTIISPNPFILNKHRREGITFDNLTDMATIRIFNISGEEIERFEKGDKEGKYIWKNPNLASGVYIYIITNPKGEKSIGKLGVIK